MTRPSGKLDVLRLRLDLEDLLVGQREQIVRRACAVAASRRCTLLIHFGTKKQKAPICRGELDMLVFRNSFSGRPQPAFLGRIPPNGSGLRVEPPRLHRGRLK